MSALLLAVLACSQEEPGQENPWAAPPDDGVVEPATVGTTPPPTGPADERPPPSDEGCQPAAYALAAHPTGGKAITLSGTISGQSSQGSMLLELVRPGSRESLYGLACSAQSAFSVSVPAGLGEVALVIFSDENGNGPDAQDRAGRAAGTLTIADDDLSGLAITVADSPELGDAAPPYAVPGGAGEGPPAEGDAGDGLPSGEEGATEALEDEGGTTP